jgi:hypothetical protein
MFLAEQESLWRRVQLFILIHFHCVFSRWRRLFIHFFFSRHGTTSVSLLAGVRFLHCGKFGLALGYSSRCSIERALGDRWSLLLERGSMPIFVQVNMCTIAGKNVLTLGSMILYRLNNFHLHFFDILLYRSSQR